LINKHLTKGGNCRELPLLNKSKPSFHIRLRAANAFVGNQQIRSFSHHMWLQSRLTALHVAQVVGQGIQTQSARWSNRLVFSFAVNPSSACTVPGGTLCNWSPSPWSDA
jgi:hypothetical protein